MRNHSGIFSGRLCLQNIDGVHPHRPVAAHPDDAPASPSFHRPTALGVDAVAWELQQAQCHGRVSQLPAVLLADLQRGGCHTFLGVRGFH